MSASIDGPNGAGTNGGNSEIEEVYDIVFAGGGTAACVVAGRLSAADPALKILVIEAGDDTQNSESILTPGHYFPNFLARKPTFYHHVAQKSDALGGRAPVVQAGKAVGGGSSVNWMTYTRAPKSDYDDWEAFGNPGWGSKDLIPLAIKLETSYLPTGHASLEPSSMETHGKTGPIVVSAGSFKTSIGSDFLETASRYDKDSGRKHHFRDGEGYVDGNDFGECNKFTPWHMYLNPKNGTRSDAAHAYLYPQLSKNTNLKLLTRNRVVRVIFEGTKATGVEYVDDTDRNSLKRVKASRLVVVSSGPFGSPVILERSGIGSKAILEKFDINQIVDLPGVGENCHDHTLALPMYIAESGATCFDNMFLGIGGAFDEAQKIYNETKGGMMTHNGLDAGIKYRPISPSEVKAIGPQFEKRWKEKYESKEDKPVIWMGTVAYTIGPRPAEPTDAKYYSLAYYLTYSHSTGSVHIASATDTFKPFIYETGFMNEPSDVALLRHAYKRSREFSRRMKSYRGCSVLAHPKFSEDSEASLTKDTMPVDVSADDIKYSQADDELIDEFHRRTVATTWHSLGTCAMKPLSKGGVVDSRLNVYGTQNLKVADLSISPDNVGANTYNTALIIGEKAALIIAEDLGIVDV